MTRLIDYAKAARAAALHPVAQYRLLGASSSRAVEAQRLERLNRAKRLQEFVNWESLKSALHAAPDVQREFLTKGFGRAVLADFEHPLRALLIVAPGSEIFPEHVPLELIMVDGKIETVPVKPKANARTTPHSFVVKEILLQVLMELDLEPVEGGGPPSRALTVRRLRARKDGSFTIEAMGDRSVSWEAFDPPSEL